MPLYFFNVYDEFHKPDPDGTELSSVNDVGVEAVILAGYLLKDHAADVIRSKEWRLDVADESGAVVFSLDVQAKTHKGADPQTSEAANA